MMTRYFLPFCLSLCLLACGDDAEEPMPMADATPDAMDDAAMDAAADATPDAEPDAEPDAAPDAEPDASADAMDDAPDDASRCPRSIEDRIAGVCDGIGMSICTMWAADNGGGTATATCVPPEGRCARANVCDGDSCRCGEGPECGDDQMCVSGVAGFTCVCLPEMGGAS